MFLLDKKTYKLLKSIYSGRKTEFPLKSEFADELAYLWQNNYVTVRYTQVNEFNEPTKNSNCVYSITLQGKHAIEERKWNERDNRITRAISIISLIISLASSIVSIVK